MTRVRPVILCGGGGRRLWPLSSPRKPKPFHRLNGDLTLFQNTLQRFRGPVFLDPVVVCAQDHVEAVERQAQAVGARLHALVVETAPRGTLTAALLGVMSSDGDDLCLIAPADHVIDKPQALIEAINLGVAAEGRLVLFGARPDRPHSGLGHILPEALAAAGARDVATFVEKPAPEMSAVLMASGALWNMGLVLGRRRAFADAAQRWTPATWRQCRLATNKAVIEEHRILVGRCPAPREASLDRAILERAANLSVVECDAGWRDVGCWRSIWDSGGLDESRNRLEGPSQVIDATGCLVVSSRLPVAVIGLNDVVVVSTEQGVLVMPRDRAQDVGALKH